MLEFKLNQNYCVRFRLFSIFFIICVGLLFIRLGVWQLHRYHQKQQMLQQNAYAATIKPLSIDAIAKRQQKNNWPLYVNGYYVPKKIIFLEQDVRYQKRGYDVLQAFRVIGQHRWLLVNRGWLPLLGQTLPSIKTPLRQMKLQGRTKLPSRFGLMLGPEVFNPGSWPLKIQRLHISTIQKLMNHAMFPFVLRLDPSPNSVFKRNYLVVNVMPQRHMSYALQWFAFAFTLWVAYGFFIVQRVDGVEYE